MNHIASLTASRTRTAQAASLALAALLLAGGAHADASAAKAASAKADSFLAPALTAKAASGWSTLILKTGGPLTAAQEKQMRSLGADITRRLPLISSVALRVPTRNLGKLAALPFAAHLSSDGAVKKTDEFTCAASGAGAAYSQYGLTGQGITVAVVDSGIATGNTDIQDSAGNSRVLACANFADNNCGYYAWDPCGHGTHVAGIIGGNGANSTGSNYTHTFYGIARKANLVNVRVLDDRGQGTVSTVISGIQWVVQNKNQYSIRVMNLSLGHPVGESYTTDPLCQAVEAAWKAGIVVVCAAGNNGRASATQHNGDANEGWGTAYGSITSPGNDPYVITVGATKSVDVQQAHDRIASYSGRGPSRLDLILKPDIIAPGNKVISLDVDYSNLNWAYAATNAVNYNSYSRTPGQANSCGYGLSNNYYVLSGTSMAAPVVAGAAALLLQKYPTLTPDTVKARLMISADKWADPSGNADPCTYGAGYLNIPAALACRATVTGTALSPALYQDGGGNVYLDYSKMLSASHIIWGTSGLTDLHVIWGTGLLSGSNVLSASHVIWGTSVFADHVIWGTNSDAVDLSSIAIGGE